NGSFAIRNERYKLLHYYINTNSKYYSEYTIMPDDDNIADTGVCNPSTNGNFTYFFFDLWEDPYEYNNLYSNSSYDTIKVSRNYFTLIMLIILLLFYLFIYY